MRGEVLGPDKAGSPSVGQCQGGKTAIGGWLSSGTSSYKKEERKWGRGYGYETRKGLIFAM